jgi:hypothetical protein
MSDSTDARDWVAEELGRLRRMRFDDLAARTKTPPDHREMLTRDGKSLVLETSVVWDDHREQTNVRVLVDVWDPSKRISGSIARGDFILAPDGTFIGE